MQRFSTKHRDRSMIAFVSYHGVPIRRGLAFVYYHCEKHKAKISIHSANRVVSVIAEHNHQFGTNLHAQQYLVDMHRKDPAHFAAANSPTTTSHCGYSDGSPIYRNSRGHVPAGGRIPWYQEGVDVDDLGKFEDNSHLLLIAHSLGYPLTRPYNAGSERHHLVLASNPIPVLEHWGVIAKTRRS